MINRQRRNQNYLVLVMDRGYKLRESLDIISSNERLRDCIPVSAGTYEEAEKIIEFLNSGKMKISGIVYDGFISDTQKDFLSNIVSSEVLKIDLKRVEKRRPEFKIRDTLVAALSYLATRLEISHQRITNF